MANTIDEQIKMTALPEYERLETSGIWREGDDAQRRDVVVSFGDATLVLADHNDTPITHWSLPAVVRLNPGNHPAIYSPDADGSETLEISDEVMIEAIERVHKIIARRRARPGRLRWLLMAGTSAALVGAGVFWLPDALINYTASLIPEVKRNDISRSLLVQTSRVTGAPCVTPTSTRALRKLEQRLNLGHEQLFVVPTGVKDTVHLPNGTILINRALVEDFEEPEVLAGFVIAEALRAKNTDPLETMLHESGLLSAVKLLTTSEIDKDTLNAYGAALLRAEHIPVSDDDLLAAFEAVKIRAAPYALAIDISGETTIGLIEADPFAKTLPTPVLPDGDWIGLQAACGA